MLSAAYEKKISDLTSQLADTKHELDRLIEQIKLANMRYFGSRSEKVIPGQLSLFNECEATSSADTVEPNVEDVLPHRRPRRRGGKPVIDYSKFETVIIDHEIEPGSRMCPECEGSLSEMSVEVTKKIRIVPAHLVVEEHRRHVYRCERCCDDNAAGGESKGVIVLPTLILNLEKRYRILALLNILPNSVQCSTTSRSINPQLISPVVH